MNKKLLAACLLGTTIFFTGCSNSISSASNVAKNPTATQTSFSIDVGLKLSAFYVDENTISVDMIYSWIDDRVKNTTSYALPPVINQFKYISFLKVNQPVAFDKEYELELKKEGGDSFLVVLSKYIEEPSVLNRGIVPKMIPVQIKSVSFANLKKTKQAVYDSTINISQ